MAWTWKLEARTVQSALLAMLLGVSSAVLFSPAAKAEPQKMSLRLDWSSKGDHAPFFLALSRGYYKQEGIDLQIFDGKGSLSTLTAVSEGSDTIGVASLATMALSVSQGRQLLAIGGIYQTLPDGIISLPVAGIKKPKDLEGKTWGYNPEDYSARIFPMFAKAAGIDESKIKKIQLSPSVVLPSLLQHKIDFMIGWYCTSGLNIERQQPVDWAVRYADAGINMLGGGIVVTRKTAADKPEALRGFLRATVRGFDEARKDPEAAVNAMFAARPAIDQKLAVEQLKCIEPYFHSPRSAGKGFGYMAAEDWEQTLTLMKAAFEFKADVKAGDLYTNEYLPKAAP